MAAGRAERDAATQPPPVQRLIDWLLRYAGIDSMTATGS